MAETSAECPLEMAHRQLRAAAEGLALEEHIHAILQQPMRSIRVALPVQMDDGTHRVFMGYRVQHNWARGPCKGDCATTPRSTRTR